MENEFTMFMKRNRTLKFHLVRAPGNAGDKLIRKGLLYFIESNSIYLTADPHSADMILVQGGGNIDDIWVEGIRVIRQIIRSYPDKTLVVAPSSCHFFTTDFERILNSSDQEVHFFCREKYSHDVLSKMNLNKNIKIYLADDTAFLLEKSDFLKNLQNTGQKKHRLFAMRTDIESNLSSMKLETLNILRAFFNRFNLTDKIVSCFHKHAVNKFVSKNFSHYKSNDINIVRDIAFLKTSEYIRFVNQASEIHTDRLHVAILGAMLGKTVRIYPTRFKKNIGVYEYSLKNYSNVKFAANMV